MRRIATVTFWVMVVFVALVVNSIGLPVPFRPLVVGTYEMGDHHEMVLQLNANGTFTESITFTNGTRGQQNGTWKMADGTVHLDKLWVPPTFPPKAAAQEDGRKSTVEPKLVDAEYWSISPEFEWGRVVLNVYSDDDVMFRKKW